jgi:hypothetical protein
MRMRITVLALGVLGAMAIGSTSALATPKGNALTATAPIQEGNADCGANLEEVLVLGSVKFTRTNDALRFAVSMEDGAPDTKYEVYIYGNGCRYFGEPVAFTTNRYGVGKAQGTVAIPGGDTEFFADPYDTEDGYSNDTPYVSLP